MKKQWIAAVLSSMVLISCGGSDSGSSNNSNRNQTVTASLKSTSWEKACTPMYDASGQNPNPLWNVTVKLRIDSALQSTYRTNFFSPTDTSCDTVIFDAMDIANFTFAGTAITEESIEAYNLNQSTLLKSDDTPPLAKYTVIYIDSEKLYFGLNSGENLGETPDTRHSSISLDDYFTQIVN